MRYWKRLLYYLSINVLVSACTVLAVLTIWDRARPEVPPEGEPVAQVSGSGAAAASIEPGLGTGGGMEEPQESPAPAEPAATREPEEESSPARSETYEVQSGDTLGIIASELGISVEELIELNELTDPDRLEVGQILRIPTPEGDEPTEISPPPTETEVAEATETPRPTSRPSPVASGDAQVLIESVVGAGDLDSERVMLKGVGPGELSLAGWKLQEEGGEVFIFPQLTLFEGGAVNLYTRAGQPTVVDLYWDLEAPVWSSGETVVLLDNQDEVHATYQVP